MHIALVAMLGLVIAGPVSAQQPALDCGSFAPRVRAAAVEARESLNSIRDFLPPDLEKAGDEGTIDADSVRQFGTTMPKEYGSELAEAMLGTSYLLVPLEAATQRLEVAASAMEACAAKAP